MTTAASFAELERMSDKELRERHDQVARHTQVGLQWYLDELRRREVARQTRALVRLTWFIAAMTVANVVLVAVAVART